MNQTFRILCRWELCGTLLIDAPTREEAIRKAYGPEVSLPEGDYVCDSFRVDDEAVSLAPPPEVPAP